MAKLGSMFAVFAVFVWAQNAPPQNTERRTVDRILVVVKDQVITASDWDEQCRLEALIDGRPPGRATRDPAALDRLVERVLLVQQMNSINFPRATAPEVDKKLAEVRQQTSGAATDAGWRAILGQYGLKEEELRTRLAETIDVLSFIDVKFRAGVRIPQREVEKYYRETLTPQLVAKNSAVPPLEDVRVKISAILTEQRVNALLEEWLSSLKAEGSIRWMGDSKPEIK